MSQTRSTRRKFLKATAAASSLAVLSPEEVFALLQSGTTFMRPNVKNLTATSPVIVAYKAGINAMKALPASNPLNWNTWANIHGSPSGTGTLWNTCQHGHWWFLPWHRMYLLYFERIIRKLSNAPTFALPFWDYTDPTQRALPSMFRTPTTNNALYIPQRNSGINAGQQMASSVVQISTAMGFTNFTGPTGSGASFGSQTVSAPNHSASPHGQLETTPHDSVHVTIGGYMGSFGTAARDPIFWLHHSNIDRLWNEWLIRGGGRVDPNNSTWCNQVFSFFNENGARVNIRVRDVLNALAQLNYRYEGQATVPTQSCPPATAAAAPLAQPLNISQRTLMQREGAVTLGATAVTHTMPMPAADIQTRAKSIIPDVKRSLVLRLEGVRIDAPPGVIYEVYVGLPAGTRPDPTGPHYVGNLAPFGAEGHAGHAPAEFVAAFRVDEAAGRALQANPQSVSVTFVPRGLFVGEREQPVQLQGRVTFARMRVIEE